MPKTLCPPPAPPIDKVHAPLKVKPRIGHCPGRQHVTTTHVHQSLEMFVMLLEYQSMSPVNGLDEVVFCPDIVNV